ncbi:alpha/beta hydrolase [Roseibacillus ishigakijimensis]|uniref:Alpha/beta hydrolase n=1 Tax=Roseibacillus ishigakijimensis TaxID=454146 RepID=A0A934RR18_9BACT|nr:alpha/beta hydrolase [Roseibacillus ishigakijimensis]MBK1834327.1 alpha/beta hydrolase [Roseibacillus ishigakijimensis]
MRMLLFFCLTLLPLAADYPPQIAGARVETYAEVGEEALQVWIIGEKVEGQAKPAVVLFFGGGWRFGSPDSLKRHARFLARRGMICLLADYRVWDRQRAKVADGVTDAKAAIAWTRQHAGRLGIDPQRIAAGGASAGGHLAACAALVPGFGHDEAPNALLLFNAPLVLAPFADEDFGLLQRLTKNWLGAEPDAVSPIHHLSRRAPPTWMAHGSADAIVPIATARTFQREMEKWGASCQLFEAEEMPHAFHYRDPWFSKVMAGAEEFFRELGWLESQE